MPLTIIGKPTKNHSARGADIRCIVLHADAAANEAGTISWIQSPASGVSYHYLVGRDGTIYQFVQDDRKAWHAGKSAWDDVTDVNPVSLGVSFSNDQINEPFTDAALAAGAELCAKLCKAHNIPVDELHLTTHAVVCRPPGRKTDPGPKFPLDPFRLQVCGFLVP
jgi:N-acetylmuramoyl-L-alanine amidase